MKLFWNIVGKNLLLLALYAIPLFVHQNIMNGLILMGHSITLFIFSLFAFFDRKTLKGQAYLLALILVLLVGFSFCTK